MTINLQDIQKNYNICKAESVKMAEDKLPIYKNTILKVISECSAAISAKPFLYNIQCMDSVTLIQNDGSTSYTGSERYIAAEKVSREEGDEIVAELKEQGKCTWHSGELYITGNRSGAEYYEHLIKVINTAESADRFNIDMHGMTGLGIYGSNDAVFGSCDTAISYLFKSFTNMYYAADCESAFKEGVASYISGLTNQAFDEIPG